MRRYSPSAVLYGAGILLLVTACVLRLLSYPVITSDYTYFVKVWFDTLGATHGLSAFVHPFADYAPLYLYLLKLLTFIPLSSLVLAKTLSLAFDVAIAAAFYLIIKRTSAWPKGGAFFAGAVAFALPTVMADSTFWGQSDSVYAAFIIFAFYCMLMRAPLAAALLFGLALSTKVQAIFFLPVFLGWLYRERALLRYAALPPLVFVASVIPAAVAGGSLSYWLLIYTHQAHEYPYLSVSAQSVFAFVQYAGISIGLATQLFWVGIIAALTAAALIALYIAFVHELTPRTFTLAALAAALALPYLLPRMHERYFYLADLFATLYVFFAPSRWWLALIVVSSSLMSYVPFLSGQVGFLKGVSVDLRLPAALLLVPLGAIVYDLIRAWHRRTSTGDTPSVAPRAL